MHIDINIERLERLAQAGLQTDGSHHKQWYLEQILQEIIGDEKFQYIRDQWNEGTPP